MEYRMGQWKEQRKAAKIGDLLEHVDTPSLILDLDAFENNLKIMMHQLQGSGIKLRVHAKSHKCPDIAMQQIKHGAIGICCQKVSEAYIFWKAGVQNILITNQIVGPQK